MSSCLPLQGKKVLVPRGKKEAKAFSNLVEQYGGIPVEIPLIAFRAVQETTEIQHTIESLHTYDWIIFTSNVTVETFFQLLGEFDRNHFPKIAVIGEKTEQTLNQKSLYVDFIPDDYVAEGFVEKFLPIVHKGMKILLPKGNLARDYIATTLRANGVQVDERIIYETYFPEENKKKLVDLLVKKDLNILTFTSPSTVDHLIEVVNEHELHHSIEPCIIGCIGPITKKKLEAHGLRVHVMPEVYTVKHMLEDICTYITKNQ
ncbi:uroporphyrinogen-III synthase (plasmid) [Bacillus sp. 31A1R]|uniref:Uroporphyrinogen-III synthase n=1 Tax=Robertmurraya mangrovi TaxID=3098077 RepID=A0ABU5IUG1_9BACI|nr:uroporphyrinogen-III synthase [Bacillus sp. 31A1R]MDZ5470787.1 uroporphyrinogen-III synthase [Bacillus sp. 31A1R]